MLELIAAVVAFPCALLLMAVLMATSKTVSDYVRDVSRGEIFVMCWVLSWAAITLTAAPHV